MANEIEKVNTIAIADIEKFNAKSNDDIEKINAFEFTYSATIAWVGSRAVLAGGHDGTGSETPSNVIQYKTLASDANTQDFGDLNSARFGLKGSGSNIARGVFAGGKTSSSNNVTDTGYITVGSTGNASDFGDLNVGCRMGGAGGASNGTLLFSCGGRAASGRADDMEYFTIASTGNGTDAGNLSEAKSSIAATNGNTRYLIAGGYDGGAANENVVEYNDFSTSANVSDFGDLGTTDQEGAFVASTVRAVYGRGDSSSDVLEFFTVASTGNATDFGDSTVSRTSMNGWSDGTRGEYGGGDNEGGSSTNGSNIIDKITIASAGNASDVGDLVTIVADGAALSGT
tara:strand:+ start:294 stop:1322 length:1029 start_codon:yes stop_codon:yes gene_type:complete